MSIQKRIDERKCEYKTKCCPKFKEYFCDNCKLNHEDVQIQVLIHKQIIQLKGLDSGLVRNIAKSEIQELKQLCGCGCK